MASVEFVVILPRAFASLPHAGVDDLRIRRINLNSGGTGVLVYRDDFLPALTAVGGPIEATLATWAIGMTEHRRENAVGVTGIYGETGNLLPFIKTEVCPGFACV